MAEQGTVPTVWRSTWVEPFRFSPDANPYVGHRLTVSSGNRVACDCGESFEGIVDLERHQQGYRHPGISASYAEEDETPRIGNGAAEYDTMMRERRR